MRRSGLTAMLAAGVAAITAAGCGGEDFPNDPRPPSPIELTAKIGKNKVIVSPTKVDGEPIGAGLANVTISNQTDEDRPLNFSGPTDRTTDPVVAKGVLNYKLDLEEGEYVVSTDDPSINEIAFAVGPERPSAQNKLLLP